MSEPSITLSQPHSGVNQPTNDYRFALFSLTSLFFMWGFITALNDILIPHLKGVFDLSYFQASLIQFCFFGAYFLVSVPAGLLVKKVGFQKGISIGLLTSCAGCIAFIPAAAIQLYWLFLGALFILAAGITILQVAANPLVTIMGSANTASSRLTMTQAFNSLGTTIAPLLGGILLLAAVGESSEAQSVILPYLLLAAVLFLLAMVFFKIHLPTPQICDSTESESSKDISVWRYKHLVLGAIAIFVYVGGEVSIGSYMVNFLSEDHIAGFTEAKAAAYLSYYWGGAMVGRFIGAVLMQKIPAGKLLGFNSVMAIVLISLAISSSGSIAMWSLLLVGLFNSIMFPTIFSLALSGLGENTSKGSGLLCLAIVGGAIVPVLQGLLADTIGLQLSFILPLICYLYIAYYGVMGHRPVIKPLASGALAGAK